MSRCRRYKCGIKGQIKCGYNSVRLSSRRLRGGKKTRIHKLIPLNFGRCTPPDEWHARALYTLPKSHSLFPPIKGRPPVVRENSNGEANCECRRCSQFDAHRRERHGRALEGSARNLPPSCTPPDAAPQKGSSKFNYRIIRIDAAATTICFIRGQKWYCAAERHQEGVQEEGAEGVLERREGVVKSVQFEWKMARGGWWNRNTRRVHVGNGGSRLEGLRGGKRFPFAVLQLPKMPVNAARCLCVCVSSSASAKERATCSGISARDESRSQKLPSRYRGGAQFPSVFQPPGRKKKVGQKISRLGVFGFSFSTGIFEWFSWNLEIDFFLLNSLSIHTC